MVEPDPRRWRIGDQERGRRRRNIGLGAAFSLLLTALVVYQNHEYPQQYNDVLLWSVVAFVLLANLINYYRYRRYLRKIADHFLEVIPGRIRFSTAGEVSELGVDQIVALRLFRSRGGSLGHLQLLLRNNRGIRLEGYEDLEGLAQSIREQLPPEIVMER